MRKTRSSISDHSLQPEEKRQTINKNPFQPIKFKAPTKGFLRPNLQDNQVLTRKINLITTPDNVSNNAQSKYKMPPQALNQALNLQQFGSQMSNQLVPVLPKPQKNIQPPILQNLVATSNLNQDQLNLKNIALKCRNAEYNPKRFAAVIMRMKDPYRTTALVFKSGKMVITGAKTEQQSRDAARHYAKAIEQVNENQKIQLTDFKIVNMVASASVDHKICLE